MAAKVVFSRFNAAIPFLLLLAIADDALGLVILAAFYPSGPLSMFNFVALMTLAIALAWLMRRLKVASYWPYIAIAGTCSWFALFEGGFHPALALVPIIPFIPHRELTRFEHHFKLPVQVVLGLFGLVNAGVPLAAVGVGTWIVVVSLLFGKPIGILIFTWLAERWGFHRATGLTWRDLTVVGVLAGIGFTVSLFFATAAFRPGAIQDDVKMGALFSFAAAPLGVGLSFWLSRAAARRGVERESYAEHGR
jgi:NhaA family Na+:H+ antiporter